MLLSCSKKSVSVINIRKKYLSSFHSLRKSSLVKMVVTNTGSVISPSELFHLSDEALIRGSMFSPMMSTSNNSDVLTDAKNGWPHDCKASPLLKLMWRANSFLMQGLQSRHGGSCLPLLVGRLQVGVLRHDVVELLQRYPDVFICSPYAVALSPKFDTPASRTAALDEVLRDIRRGGQTAALRSWRDEKFAVWGHDFVEPLMAVERSAMALLGIRAFGVHLTGFVRNAAGDVAGVWLQKRADNKPTYPGMMDNMVAGGMSDSLTATQVLFKEAEEEASIPAHLIERAKSAGSVSFLTESDRGIHANTEYVFDLELPADFKPSINDGEVQGFALITTEDIMPYLLSPNFKLTSAPVLLDFLIRHGIVNSNTVVDLPQITEMLHTPISFYYRSWPTFPSSSFVGPREGFPTPVDAKYSSEQAPSSSSATYSFSSTSVVPNTSPHLEGGSGPSSVLKNNCSFSIADDDCASMKSEDRDSDADLYQICLDQGT